MSFTVSSSSASSTTQIVSTIRRKPVYTYRSPLPGSPMIPIPIFSKTSSTTVRTTTIAPTPAAVTRRTTLTLVPVRHQYWLEPSLPLYHPLGKLAQSLPELDPERYGLPVPPKYRDRESSKRATRSRKPVAKVREGDLEDEAPSRDGDDVEGESEENKSGTADGKEKEKSSPRKRRNGGGINKRKRVQADDGDAAYPAKRTRMPRGAQAQTSAQDEPSPAEAQVPETPETMAVDSEDKVPERRTTRATRGKGSNKRRDSTASSETPGTRSGSTGSKSKGDAESDESKKPITRRSRSQDNEDGA
ncbi:hypothetical protein C8J56DRAFT_777682 [Mycena floridula]|nr:hypothetical protein C8J56DRAFT_777682 [Mycena floridula]